MVLGLAFAAVVVPVAPAGAASLSIFVDNGRVAPKSDTISLSTPPSYLRYHEVGAPVAAGPQATSERSRTVATITPLQADGLRWTAMAKAYEQNQSTAAISERSYSTPAQLTAETKRWLAMAQATRPEQQSVAISERSNGVKGPDPSLVPQVVLATSNSFDWSDAGIGASTVFAAALLLGIAILYTRRNQHSGLTSA